MFSFLKQRKFLVINTFVLILFLGERLVKWRMDKTLAIDEYQPIFNQYFGWQLHHNQQIAGFSAPLLFFYFCILIILFILFLLLLRYYLCRQWQCYLFVLLILLGGISNFADRLIRGYVIDFIRISFLPIFNFADIMILIGAGGWLIYALCRHHSCKR